MEERNYAYGLVIGMDDLFRRVEKLEYYQRLMLELMPGNTTLFYREVMRAGLDEEDVKAFFQLCEGLNNKCQKQKAEGFVYFTPLFKEFERRIDRRLTVERVIEGCLNQGIYPSLMTQLRKCL